MRRVRGTFIAVGALYLIDAFVLAQGVFSTLAALIAVLVLLVRLVTAKVGARKLPAIKIGVWLALPFAAIGTICGNNILARHRADSLIVAVNEYRARHADYPKRLEDLVPEILPSVPRAKCTLMFNDFYYSNSEGNVWMMYTSLPPFGRPSHPHRC